MEMFMNVRPCWASVVETGIVDEVWVELESGSIVPIHAPRDVLDLLEAGVSVLVDVDRSGQAVPWSTFVVTRAERDLPLPVSDMPEAAPVPDRPARARRRTASLRYPARDPSAAGAAAA